MRMTPQNTPLSILWHAPASEFMRIQCTDIALRKGLLGDGKLIMGLKTIVN
jgi:hypothetical protein